MYNSSHLNISMFYSLIMYNDKKISFWGHSDCWKSCDLLRLQSYNTHLVIKPIVRHTIYTFFYLNIFVQFNLPRIYHLCIHIYHKATEIEWLFIWISQGVYIHIKVHILDKIPLVDKNLLFSTNFLFCNQLSVMGELGAIQSLGSCQLLSAWFKCYWMCPSLKFE